MGLVTKETETRYSCAFCRTGFGEMVARELALMGDGMQATPVLFSILSRQKRDPTLISRDRQFPQWVFANDGVATMPKVLMVGDNIQIISSLLKGDHRSEISTHKRSCNGLVEFKFALKIWQVWQEREMMEVA